MRRMGKQIYINGRFLLQTPTGVQRYAYEMCAALHKCGVDFTLICPKKGTIKEAYNISLFKIQRYGVGTSHLWEQLVLPFFFIGKKNYILINFTGLGSIAVPNKIMTIHDLSFLVCRQWFSQAYYYFYKPMTWMAAKTSKHLITVSQFSKQEIMRFYPFIKDDKISVIYGAVDSIRFHRTPSIPSSENPFALAVSSIDPRKNFSMLVKAFKGIEGCQLYIVGKQNHVFSQQNGLNEDIPNVKFLGRVSDEELRRLYNQAVCFIFPSIYEGFGLPLLEAMTCGCPVLASDIPVFREVCGDAAIYFNPYDETSIRHSIDYFLSLANQEQEKLQTAGYERAQRFSWEQSARDIIDFINEKMNYNTIS